MEPTNAFYRATTWVIARPVLTRLALTTLPLIGALLAALFTQDAAWACNGTQPTCGGG